MKVNQMRFLTAHNAFASQAYGYPDISKNQNLSITGQLQYGARAFMLDVWDWEVNGTVEILCSHGRPAYGQTYTTLDAVLSEITNFFNTKSSQVIVVVLLLEDYVDENHNTPSRFELLQKKLAATACYFDLVAQDVPVNGWPDITRSCILAFTQNYKPSYLPSGTKGTIPNMYDLCVETVYGDASTNHNTWNLPRQESNPCGGAAKAPGISVDNTLAIINHFPTDPLWLSSDYAGNYNALNTLDTHRDTFIWNNNRIPNFLAVNFVNTGAGSQMLTGWTGLTNDFRYPHWMPWVAPGDMDFGDENIVVVPDGQFITAIEGLNKPGRGIVNLRVWTASPGVQSAPLTPQVNFMDQNLGHGWMTNEFDGLTQSDVRTLAVPAGSRFGAMLGCWMDGYGLVNIWVPGASRPRSGTASALTYNEGLNADKVGPNGLGTTILNNNDNIRAFHIRYGSSQGVADMRYAYE